MCGRYYIKPQKQEIAERMCEKKVFDEPFLSNFNIAPTMFQPIVRPVDAAHVEGQGLMY
jgi:putative SOS response-associated peptidase YedK